VSPPAGPRSGLCDPESQSGAGGSLLHPKAQRHKEPPSWLVGWTGVGNAGFPQPSGPTVWTGGADCSWNGASGSKGGGNPQLAVVSLKNGGWAGRFCLRRFPKGGTTSHTKPSITGQAGGWPPVTLGLGPGLFPGARLVGPPEAGGGEVEKNIGRRGSRPKRPISSGPRGRGKPTPSTRGRSRHQVGQHSRRKLTEVGGRRQRSAARI